MKPLDERSKEVRNIDMPPHEYNRTDSSNYFNNIFLVLRYFPQYNQKCRGENMDYLSFSSDTEQSNASEGDRKRPTRKDVNDWFNVGESMIIRDTVSYTFKES